MHARLTRGTRRLPTWLVGVTLAAVGATLLVGGSPRRAATPSVSTPQLLPTRLRASLPVTPALRIAPKTLSIEQIRVGDRVLAGNPEGENSAETEVDAGRWRKLELTLGDGDGRLDIALLRPADWVVDVGAGPGSVVRLDLPEVGAEGLAQVRSVGPCPPVRTGPGRVVTGTFAHASAEVIDLAIAGESEPIGVTARHRFYSEDRRSFVPAGRLREGERIRQLDGVARVASIRPRPGRHRVYNLEVNREHVFRVGARGLLVHNEYLQVDPGDLHVPASRPDGADFFKLTKQMKDFGDSFAGMPAIDVRRGAGGSLEIVNGVTRATRAFLSAPGSKVLVRVIEEAPGVRFLEATIRALHP